MKVSQTFAGFSNRLASSMAATRARAAARSDARHDRGQRVRGDRGRLRAAVRGKRHYEERGHENNDVDADAPHGGGALRDGDARRLLPGAVELAPSKRSHERKTGVKRAELITGRIVQVVRGWLQLSG